MSRTIPNLFSPNWQYWHILNMWTRWRSMAYASPKIGQDQHDKGSRSNAIRCVWQGYDNNIYIVIENLSCWSLKVCWLIKNVLRLTRSSRHYSRSSEIWCYFFYNDLDRDIHRAPNRDSGNVLEYNRNTTISTF